MWDGPDWLEYKQPLKIATHLEFRSLFQVLLEIPDATYHDVLDDLLKLKCRGLSEEDSPIASAPSETEAGLGSSQTSVEQRYDPEEIEKRYDYLWKCENDMETVEKAALRKHLLSKFEHQSLIYFSEYDDWYPPSQCVWVESNVNIPEKCSIAEAYPTKKRFFTDILGILEPDVGMYIDSLEAQAGDEPSRLKILDTMTLICRMGVGETDTSRLVNAEILPILTPDGESSFVSPASAASSQKFVIMDNAIHRNVFKGKTGILHFALEEIRDIRPLLVSLNLGGRFSSRLVREVTTVEGGSRDDEMTNRLRHKSRALVRYHSS